MESGLRTVLSHYPASARPFEEPEPLGNAGGLSGSTLWRFRSGSKRLAARAWPVDGPPRPVLDRIHAWQARAGVLGFVPTPIPTNDGRTLVEHGGRLWEVSPWMEGSPDLGSPPKLARLRAGFAGLAAFHQVLRAERFDGANAGILSRLVEVESWLSGGFEALGAAILNRPLDPNVATARLWLDEARKAAPRVRQELREGSRLHVTSQPCLRDARPEHFLFRDDRLSGLIDFGAMGIDSIAADLARLCSEWLGSDRLARAEALAAYSAIRPIEPGELALIPVFERSTALLTGGRWASWHFLEGRPFDDPRAVAQGLERGVERVRRLAE